MSALVSVAMATYNGEKYIEDQIASIFSQTYKNIELVVVDDCSSDRTVELVNKLARKNNIKLFKNEKNLGLIKNFEKAISNCNGDYIALADQDDIWLKNKIEVLLNKIDGYSLVYTDAEIIDKNGKLTGESFSNRNCLVGMDSSNKEYFQYNIFNPFVLGCTMLFNSNLKHFILPIKLNKFNHDRFITIIASQVNGISYVNQKLFYYRIHENNITIKKNQLTFSENLKKRGRRKSIPYEKKDLQFLLDLLVTSDGFQDHSNNFLKQLITNIGKFDRSNIFGRIMLLLKYNRYIFANTSKNKKLKAYLSYILNG